MKLINSFIFVIIGFVKCSFAKSSCTSFLSTWNTISRNTWRRRVPHCRHSKRRASLIRFSNHSCSCTRTAFSIVIWSRRTCSSARTVKWSSLPISVWPVPSACLSRPIRMRSWPYGTAARRSCSPRSTTPSASTSGPLAASSRRWLKRDRCSRVIARLIRSSKYSKYLARRTRTTGRMRSNCRTSRHHSQGSKASRCRTTRQR